MKYLPTCSVLVHSLFCVEAQESSNDDKIDLMQTCFRKAGQTHAEWQIFEKKIRNKCMAVRLELACAASELNTGV